MYDSNNKGKAPVTTEQKIDAIFRILTGEPLDPKDDGLIGDFRKLKTEFYKLLDWKKRTVAWALGVAFGGGALVAFIIATVLNMGKK